MVMVKFNLGKGLKVPKAKVIEAYRLKLLYENYNPGVIVNIGVSKNGDLFEMSIENNGNNIFLCNFDCWDDLIAKLLGFLYIKDL